MRAARTFIALAAAFSLVAVSCGNDSDGNTTDVVATPDVTTESGINDLEAEARTAALEFFEAYAVLDLEQATGRATGAAQDLLEWAAKVDGIDDVEGTTFEPIAAPSVEVTVAIESVSEGDVTDTIDATGFVEVQRRPPLLAVGTIPPDLEEPPETWFITDLRFTQDEGRLSVDDFRLDDSPYPISELVTEHDGIQAIVMQDHREANLSDTTTTSAQATTTEVGQASSLATLDMTRRDLDGSVQYLVIESVRDLDLTSAEFFAPTEDDRPPKIDESGESVDLYLDQTSTDDLDGTASNADGDVDLDMDADANADMDAGADADGATVETGAALELGDTGERVLAVRPGAFPGTSGVLRLTFSGSDGMPRLILDLPIPEPVELGARPVNEVRDARTPDTTTTTDTSTTSSTTMTAPDPSFVPVPVPVPTPTPPPTNPETTSTTESTTTTTVPA